MNFWKTNEFQKVNGELINSVIDTMTGDSNVDDKVMLVTNFFWSPSMLSKIMLITFSIQRNGHEHLKLVTKTFRLQHRFVSNKNFETNIYFFRQGSFPVFRILFNILSWNTYNRTKTRLYEANF